MITGRLYIPSSGVANDVYFDDMHDKLVSYAYMHPCCKPVAVAKRVLPILSIQAKNNAFSTEVDPGKELHSAIREGDKERVKKLLADGISPTKENEEGMTPLDTAAKAGEAEIFKMVFIKASEIEREKDDYKKLAEKWNDAVGSLENKAEKVQLQSAVKGMSSVQYVEAYRLCFCRSYYM